jgi:predicted glycoside hydrolase/deacetylase ChbG (UPF0249 family)
MLIVNADDWGRDQDTTDSILKCWECGALTSASAMVFMEDSARASEIARTRGLDTGLHLNLTSPFTRSSVPAALVKHQQVITKYLRSSKLAPALFNSGLCSSFEYVVRAQLDEYCNLFGAPSERVDGHHHMHLSANVIRQQLLPSGSITRRNFSFAPGEKSWLNRKFRELQDRRIARRHRMADFFFSLPPLQPVSRLQRIFGLAQQSTVEVETHPASVTEFQFLTGGDLFRLTRDLQFARTYQVSPVHAN